jgi:hypothetical protein
LIFTLCPLPQTPTNTPTRTPTRTFTPTNTATPTACVGGCGRFADVPESNSFYTYIHCLDCNNIMSGYTCGGLGEPCNNCNNPYFRPSFDLTRAQMAKVVSESAQYSDVPSGQQFQDVPPSDTFYPWVYRIAAHGILGGYVCGGPDEPCVAPLNLPYYRPYASATRGQLSKAISNARGFAENPSGQQFNDVPPGSTFYEWVYRVYIHGIASGYACGGAGEPCECPYNCSNLPYFRPNNGVTRSQAAKMVAIAWNYRFGCNLGDSPGLNPEITTTPIASSTPAVTATPSTGTSTPPSIPSPWPTIPAPIPTGQTTVIPTIPPVPTVYGTIPMPSVTGTLP